MKTSKTTTHDKKWQSKKVEAIKLSNIYENIGKVSKAERVRDCGVKLTFLECPNGHDKQLSHANFCKVRLCPMCAWRRSRKLIQQLKLITHEANKSHNVRWLFLTLTVQNVDSSELSDEITRIFKAWQRLSQRKVFKDSVIGWFRALEVTRNQTDWTYHPHLHVLLAVKPAYFSGNYYITQEKWTSLWRESLQVEYQPIIDIRQVKPKRDKSKEQEYLSEIEYKAAVDAAILEVAKYPIKSQDYLKNQSKQSSESVVSVLDEALSRRRMVAYGGILKEAWNKLNTKVQTDDDLTDLIDDKCTCSICNSNLIEQVYFWHSKRRDYLKINI